MATTKTLTPTNQAITIAAFTEKPDNRVNATNDDKLADAVNALNSNIVKSIAEGADLNTITEPGFYNFSMANTLVNAPVEGTNRLGLIVQRSESNLYVTQLAFENLQLNYGVYFRRCLGGTWSSWEKFALASNLSNKVKAGTTEANVISFSTTVSFTSGVGYADASSVLPSGYRISIPVAAAVSTGSLAVTGCMKEERSNNRIRIQLSNASYSGDAAFNIIATIVRI